MDPDSIHGNEAVAALAEAGPIPASAGRSRRRLRVRRLVANLLILGGLLVLLYPVGTWVYAWWQQRALQQQLVRTHPILAVPLDQIFKPAEMVPTSVAASPQDGQAFRSQEQNDQRLVELRSLRNAAGLFAGDLAAKGAAAGGSPIGRLVIPKIGVSTVLVEGVGRGDLREGPGHWPETPLPGMGGNFVVSGHRTTYGGPFFKLDRLKPGDEIQLILPYAAATYRVSRTMIVLPTQTEVVAQRGKEELSLATCHPIYSARQRLVVQADMTSFKILNTP
jgi:LPXTG-site transpeptidase (sortase) family protein